LTDYYEGYKSNPILTHRHLGQKYPIANVGHGDLVETPNGEWWMVLLASRPYGGYYRNLGRETYLTPVTWENDWPVVNYGVGLVLDEEKFPVLTPVPAVAPSPGMSQTLDFTNTREFPIDMMHLRNPVQEDYVLSESGLRMRAAAGVIHGLNAVSYYCLRQQHMSFDVCIKMHFAPTESEEAGIVVFQSHKYNYQFLLSLKNGEEVLRVVKCENEALETLAEVSLASAFSENKNVAICDKFIWLKISARGQLLSFSYSTDGKVFIMAHENAPAHILSTDVAGGFVGNTIGMYATANGAESQNFATFERLEYEEANG